MTHALKQKPDGSSANIINYVAPGSAAQEVVAGVCGVCLCGLVGSPSWNVQDGRRVMGEVTWGGALGSSSLAAFRPRLELAPICEVSGFY